MLFTALRISGIALLHTVGVCQQSEAEAQERQGDEDAEKVTVLQASEVKEKGEVSFNTSEELQALKEMEKSAENAELGEAVCEEGNGGNRRKVKHAAAMYGFPVSAREKSRRQKHHLCIKRSCPRKFCLLITMIKGRSTPLTAIRTV